MENELIIFVVHLASFRTSTITQYNSKSETQWLSTLKERKKEKMSAPILRKDYNLKWGFDL